MLFKRVAIIGVAILLAIVLVAGITSIIGSHGANASTAQTGSTSFANSSGTQSPGIPAIAPKNNAIPSFSIADVRALTLKRGFAGGPTLSRKPPTIVTIQFMTSKEASIRMHGESVGLPDNALVCYVILRGPFSEVGQPVPQGASIGTPLLGEEVFDAQTGNLLVWGYR